MSAILPSFPSLPGGIRRGRSSCRFVYVQEAVGDPIRPKTPWSFVDLLHERNADYYSREQIDFVYRGEMNAEEQDLYIADMHIPLPPPEADHPIEGPLSPLPHRWEFGEVDLDSDFNAVRTHGPQTGPDIPAPDTPAADIISACFSPPTNDIDISSSLNSTTDFDDDDVDSHSHLVAPAALSPNSFLPSDIESEDTDDETDSLFSPDRPAVVHSPASTTMEVDELSEDDSPAPTRSEISLALEQIMSSPASASVHTSQYSASPLSSMQSSPSPSAHLLSEVSLALLQLVSTPSPVHHPAIAAMSPASDSGSDVSMESDQLAPSSPPRTPPAPPRLHYDYHLPPPAPYARSDGSGSMEDYELGYPSDDSMEYDQLAPSSPDPPTFVSAFTHAPFSPDAPAFVSAFTHMVPSADGSEEDDDLELGYPATPSARSDGSMEHDQLASSSPRTPAHTMPSYHIVSTQSSPSSDTFNQSFSSPRTPALVHSADTSLEQELPSPVPLRSPFSYPFTFRQLHGFRSASMDAPFPFPRPRGIFDQPASSIRPPSPTHHFFDADGEYVSPAGGIFKDLGRRDDPPTVEPRHLFTYAKRDRERYARLSALRSTQSGNLADPSDDDMPDNTDVPDNTPPVASGSTVTGSDNTPPVASGSTVAGSSSEAAGGVSDEDNADDEGTKTTRHSRRLRRGRVDDLTKFGVNTLASLKGYILYVLIGSRPRPLVDAHDYVVGAIAPGPKALDKWWADLMFEASRYCLRLYRWSNINFVGLDESFIRAGIWFGPNGPFQLPITGPGAKELAAILNSAIFRAISEYQNHIYRQYAAESFAYMAGILDLLVANAGVNPAFPGSVFTTTELTFFDGSSHEHYNDNAAIEAMEAVTIFGDFNELLGGHISFGKHRAVIQSPSGTTYLVPSASNTLRYTAIGKKERRYQFRQYVSAGVLRWVQKGGRTDKQFEETTTAGEREAWATSREARGDTCLNLFSQLSDIHTA
ncbi:hypothetical protein R3P38DRAFT_3477546 [Favolaschia claudopus]|uniref:Uncharacterized protein n=1 Tax=Favolaschia claudopus TaxID=2862362 RepID=A0AAV9Z9L6_9AGAR